MSSSEVAKEQGGGGDVAEVMEVVMTLPSGEGEAHISEVMIVEHPGEESFEDKAQANEMHESLKKLEGIETTEENTDDPNAVDDSEGHPVKVEVVFEEADAPGTSGPQKQKPRPRPGARRIEERKQDDMMPVVLVPMHEKMSADSARPKGAAAELNRKKPSAIDVRKRVKSLFSKINGLTRDCNSDVFFKFVPKEILKTSFHHASDGMWQEYVGKGIRPDKASGCTRYDEYLLPLETPAEVAERRAYKLRDMRKLFMEMVEGGSADDVADFAMWVDLKLSQYKIMGHFGSVPTGDGRADLPTYNSSALASTPQSRPEKRKSYLPSTFSLLKSMAESNTSRASLGANVTGAANLEDSEVTPSVKSRLTSLADRQKRLRELQMSLSGGAANTSAPANTNTAAEPPKKKKRRAVEYGFQVDRDKKNVALVAEDAVTDEEMGSEDEEKVKAPNPDTKGSMFMCGACVKIFPSDELLAKHLEEAHKVDMRTGLPISKELCKICRKRFATKRQWKEHVYTHRGKFDLESAVLDEEHREVLRSSYKPSPFYAREKKISKGSPAKVSESKDPLFPEEVQEKMNQLKEEGKMPFCLNIVFEKDADGNDKLAEASIAEDIREMDDGLFREKLGVSKPVVQELVDMIINSRFAPRNKEMAESLFLNTCMAIYYMTNSESTRAIARKFGFVNAQFRKMHTAIEMLAQAGLEQAKTTLEQSPPQDRANAFSALTGVSNCVGAVGTFFMKIGESPRHAVPWSKEFAVALKVVCLADGTFSLVTDCLPKTFNQHPVFEQSQLIKMGLQDTDFYLMVPASYSADTRLLSPNHSLLEPDEQLRWSEAAKQTCAVVERSIACIFGRFPKIAELSAHRELTTMVNMGKAACVIHNVCTRLGDDLSEEKLHFETMIPPDVTLSKDPEVAEKIRNAL